MDKKAVKPIFDYRLLNRLIMGLGTKLQMIPAGQPITQQTKTEIAQILNAIRLELDNNIIPVVQKNEDHVVPNPFRTNLDYGERESKACVKCATIRGEDVRDCPFKLSIPRACKTVGKTIHQMVPVENLSEDQQNKYASTNKIIFAHQKEDKPCPYADKILDDKFGKVDCNYGDTGEGVRSPNIDGSPLYPQTFSGVGLNGLYGFPLSWYGDNTAARNLFFGLFSYVGKEENINLLKISNDIGKILKLISDKVGG